MTDAYSHLYGTPSITAHDDRIDWLAYDQAMQTFTLDQYEWLTQPGFSTVESLRRKKLIHAECPWCAGHSENAAHLSRCVAPLAQQARALALVAYWGRPDESGMPPLIFRALRTTFLYWPAQARTIYRSTCPEVDDIGEEIVTPAQPPSLCLGIVHKWRLVQDQWLYRISTRWKIGHHTRQRLSSSTSRPTVWQRAIHSLRTHCLHPLQALSPLISTSFSTFSFHMLCHQGDRYNSISTVHRNPHDSGEPS